LAITSPTSGGRSVGIVRSRAQTMEFSLILVVQKPTTGTCPEPGELFIYTPRFSKNHFVFQISDLSPKLGMQFLVSNMWYIDQPSSFSMFYLFCGLSINQSFLSVFQNIKNIKN
jgi:hypothetical protein